MMGAKPPQIITPTPGQLITFDTDMAAPLNSCIVNFLPVQAGSGNPTPDNVRPISGWTGFDVHVEGINIIDKDSLTGTGSVWWKGNVLTGYSGNCVTPKIAVKPGARYYLNRTSNSQNYMSLFNKNKQYLRQIAFENRYSGYYYTVPNDVYYIGITISTAESSKNSAIMQFDIWGSQYSPYVQGTEYPILWEPEAGTVYGGYYNSKTGELVDEWGMIASYNGETLPGQWISDRDVYAPGTAPSIGAQVAYKRASPIIYQLTHTQIVILLGANSIWSSANGNIELSYLTY